MTQDNAALKPQSTTPASSGLHLVSPSTRQFVAPRRPIMVQPIRESHAMSTLTLGIAALSAPLVWVGHAILHWMHVL